MVSALTGTERVLMASVRKASVQDNRCKARVQDRHKHSVAPTVVCPGAELVLDLGIGGHTTLFHDFSGAHTISWAGRIRADPSALDLPEEIRERYRDQLPVDDDDQPRPAEILWEGGEGYISVNLYKFPTLSVVTPRRRILRSATEEEELVLQTIVLAMTLRTAASAALDAMHRPGTGAAKGSLRPLDHPNARHGSDEMLAELSRSMASMGQPDATGARPIHALLISNHKAALSLARDVFTLQPQQLVLQHGPFTSHGEVSDFTGENCLHIVIINAQYALALEMIRLSSARLSPHEQQLLLRACAVGTFFDQQPIGLYGSSPLAYAAVVGLVDVVAAILKHDRDRGGSLNTDRCPVTGFLPLHAVVAAGHPSCLPVIDFLVDDLPPSQRARLDEKVGLPSQKPTRAKPARSPLLWWQRRQPYWRFVKEGKPQPVGRCDGSIADLAGMSPLQLAARFGRISVFKRLLRKQTERQWDWGPLRKYNIHLDGIVELEESSAVMNVVARFDATKETQVALRCLCKSAAHDAVRAVGCPNRLHPQWWQELLLNTCMQGLIFELFIVKWLESARYWHVLFVSLDAAHTGLISYLIYEIHEYGLSRPWVHRDIAWSLLGCIGLQVCEEAMGMWGWWRSMRRESHRWWRLAQWLGDEMFAYQAASLLASSLCMALILSGALPSDDDLPSIQVGWGVHGFIYLLLSFAFVSQSIELLRNTLSPYPLFIYMLIIMRMLRSDLLRFMALGLGIFFALWGAMYAVLPPRLGMVPAFEGESGAYHSLYSLFILMMTGDPIELDFGLYYADQLSGWYLVDFVAFMVYYFGFILITVLILINLLIAMMSQTYSKMEAGATLEWRVEFARRVLRVELGWGSRPPWRVWRPCRPDEQPMKVQDWTIALDPATGRDTTFFGFDEWFDDTAAVHDAEASHRRLRSTSGKHVQPHLTSPAASPRIADSLRRSGSRSRPSTWTPEGKPPPPEHHQEATASPVAEQSPETAELPLLSAAEPPPPAVLPPPRPLELVPASEQQSAQPPMLPTPVGPPAKAASVPDLAVATRLPDPPGVKGAPEGAPAVAMAAKKKSKRGRVANGSAHARDALPRAVTAPISHSKPSVQHPPTIYGV